MKVPLHVAKEKDLGPIGFELVPEGARPQAAVAKLKELTSTMRSLAVMLETCTKCGNCRDQCHSYLGTEDYNNFPAARADLVRQVYKRYCTFLGKNFGGFVGAKDIAPETLDQWLTYFYQCNECRRCAKFCPFGIDTAEITIAARHILSELGVMPKFMQGIAANMVKTGNNMGLNKAAIIDCAEFMEDEMKEETGLEIKIPIDKPASDVLYIPSSADFFTNIDTMIGVAKFMHYMKFNWTIPSSLLEAANFGLLFNLGVMQEHNERMKEAAGRLGAKIVVQGECGHGWRAARMYTAGASAPVNYEITHILEFCDKYLEKLPLKKLPWRVSLHDPCNYARAGGIIEQPRRIVRACVEEFVEMTPCKDENFCCGGGSGILMEEMMEIRMQLGRKKAEQVKALGHLDYFAMPCSICKAQIPPVFQHYGVEIEEKGGVMDLIGKAIVLEA